MPRKKERIRKKVTIGHAPDGSPVIKWVSGYTRKEVAEKRQQVIEEFVTGSVKKDRETLYRYYAQIWYDTYKKGSLSASSKQNYACALNRHILPYIGDKQLQAVSATDLQRVMNRLDGRGKTLIGDVRSILTNTFRTAYASGAIERDPSVALKRTATVSHTKRALTEDETKAALEVGSSHPHGLLLLLLYYTGMRRGEALGLQWGDIEFDKAWMHVRRDVDFSTGEIGKVKTPAAIRSIPVPPALMSVLRDRRGLPATHVIQAPNGSYLSQATYVRWWKSFQTAMTEADPEIQKKDGRSVLTAHYFRHNYASILYEAGVDVLAAQKYLGHSDPKTTMSIYTHLSESKADSTAEKVRSIFASR